MYAMKLKSANLMFGLFALCAAPGVMSASIVNIDATLAGADIPPGGGIWNHPTGGITLTVGPGTYTFEVVNPRDSTDALYTGWSFQSTPKYYTGYLVFDAANLNAPIIDGSPSPNWFGTAQEAYDWAVSSGNYLTTRTFTQTTTLIFAVPDPYVADNMGGVSVSVFTPSISSALPSPEPGTGVLLTLTSGAAFAFVRSYRRRQSAA
jgi:hypothetical protein